MSLIYSFSQDRKFEKVKIDSDTYNAIAIVKPIEASHFLLKLGIFTCDGRLPFGSAVHFTFGEQHGELTWPMDIRFPGHKSYYSMQLTSPPVLHVTIYLRWSLGEKRKGEIARIIDTGTGVTFGHLVDAFMNRGQEKCEENHSMISFKEHGAESWCSQREQAIDGYVTSTRLPDFLDAQERACGGKAIIHPVSRVLLRGVVVPTKDEWHQVV